MKISNYFYFILESRDFVLKIYITRHGETEWNKENRLQGWKDSPLTEKGIENAKKLGYALKNVSFQKIYCSPSGRAIETAKLINLERLTPLVLEEGLKELNFGEWEGKTGDDILQIQREDYENFWTIPHKYDHRKHNGESLDALKERMRRTLLTILSDHSSGNVLLVTHAVAIRTIMSYCLNIPTDKFWEGPFIHGTSLTIFTWDGTQFGVEKIGDMSHLTFEK